MERPCILHMITPGHNMSPFDVNMAADAGYDTLFPYCDVGLEDVRGLTQDAIFSRGPKGVKRTGIFIGGRDVLLAMDMLDAARDAMVPPFEVSVMADPSGAYTTAAALIAAVERRLDRVHGTSLAQRRVLVLGGTGTVGRIAAALAALAGARVQLSSSREASVAIEAARSTGERFGVSLEGVSLPPSDTPARLAMFGEAEVVLATAAAGVQVMSADERREARRLLVAADVNAVPPAGIEGVAAMDDGAVLEASTAVGIGAMAVGSIKYQVQQRLLQSMLNDEGPRYLAVREALEVARQIVGEKS